MSDSALRLIENQRKSAPMIPSPAAAATQSGTMKRAGRYGAFTPFV